MLRTTSIYGRNRSLHSVQQGVFCPYFLVQFSPDLRDARGDIEFLLLSMAIQLSLMLLLPTERTELINAYIVVVVNFRRGN